MLLWFPASPSKPIVGRKCRQCRQCKAIYKPVPQGLSLQMPRGMNYPLNCVRDRPESAPDGEVST